MDLKNALLIKLDGLGDWIIFYYYFQQIESFFPRLDLLIDYGSEGYIRSSPIEKYLSNVAAINFRSNPVHSFFRKNNHISLLEFFYMKYCLCEYELKKKYDCIFISVWNGELERFIKRYILNNFASKRVFLSSQICNGTPGQFRGENERSFLQQATGLRISKLYYCPNKCDQISKIFIFANSFKQNKRWDQNNYINLAIKLEALGYSVEVWGIDLDNLNKKVMYPFLRQGSISELRASLLNSNLYIGNDTAFLHLAIQLRKKVVVISNGKYPNAFLNYPGEKLNIIEPPYGSINNITVMAVLNYLEANIL